jgi:hypothetical protein
MNVCYFVPKLEANITITIIVKIIKKGSHCFKKPTKLTCFPLKNTKKQSLIMFQDDEFLYFIIFNAQATCEWQLSQQRLCLKRNIIINYFI